MTAPGASLLGDRAAFRVWAPRCRSVALVVDGCVRPMTAGADRFFTVEVAGLGPGARYRYLLDDERERPDPASRWQPEGVHGPSALVDPGTFPWTDHGFRGHALADLVLYEVHVGTFTPAGTFDAIVPRLPALADLGVTAIELMPVAEFPGARNWGYDGVAPWAPQSTYGGPDGLRRLVDACHAAGLSVVLDVVYNHLGPEGNYLAEFGPYFTDRYRTPWGGAIDFDGPDSGPVRAYFVENARHWVRDFHVDGLRLDAIHAIYDRSPVHVLGEVADAVHEEAARLGRPGHVMAESHDNDRAIVLPRARGGLGLDAVWSDDFHHAMHVRLTGEDKGYYEDFADARHLVRAMVEGFAFQGETSSYFGRPRGTPSGDLGGEHFVIFAQNHDQVGNRAAGDRLATLVPREAVKLAAGLMLVAPALPLLFMGEEYGETAPFQFFTSFLDPALVEAVRRGRAEEFKRFAWQGKLPDPADPATFERSRPDSGLATRPGHRELRAYYRRWLELRRTHAALGSRGKRFARGALYMGGAVLVLTRGAAAGARVELVANLTREPQPWTAPAPGPLLLDSADPAFAGPGVARPLAPYQLLLYDAAR